MRGLHFSEANMNHTIVNCSECNKEMKIKVAAGFKAPDRSMCKACSQNPTPIPKKIKINLGKAMAIAAGYKRVRRCEHREKNFVVTGKMAPTVREAGQRKRIYGCA